LLSKYTDICLAELEQGSDRKGVNVTTGSALALVDITDGVRQSLKQQEVHML